MREETKWGYLLVVPACIGLGVFVMVPVGWSFYLSFHKWNLISSPSFVGVQYYRELFADSVFLSSLKTTFIFTLIAVPGQFLFSLMLAVLLNSRFVKFRNFFRLAYFTPVVVSMVIVSIIWAFIYDPGIGFANYLLTGLGFPPHHWLSSSSEALPAIAITTIWKYAGYYMIIFLAALQTIPEELYEAANIDGATVLQKFFWITLPSLKGTSLFTVIITTIESMRMFTQVYIMTAGGPAKSTYVMSVNIYRTAFVFMDMGKASSMAMVLFLIIGLLVAVEWRYFTSQEV